MSLWVCFNVTLLLFYELNLTFNFLLYVFIFSFFCFYRLWKLTELKQRYMMSSRCQSVTTDSVCRYNWHFNSFQDFTSTELTVTKQQLWPFHFKFHRLLNCLQHFNCTSWQSCNLKPFPGYTYQPICIFYIKLIVITDIYIVVSVSKHLLYVGMNR